MIKEKITNELKNRFISEIKKTGITNKERGFLICKDKKGNLSPSATCEGEECIIRGMVPLLSHQCPFEIQGDFHTHAGIKKAKTFLENKLKREVTNEEAKNAIFNTTKKHNLTVNMPSYGDLLSTLILKYQNHTLGTACVGTDVDNSNVECWTVNQNINEKDYDKALYESDFSNTGNIPQEWIKKYFNIEIIKL